MCMQDVCGRSLSLVAAQGTPAAERQAALDGLEDAGVAVEQHPESQQQQQRRQAPESGTEGGDIAVSPAAQLQHQGQQQRQQEQEQSLQSIGLAATLAPQQQQVGQQQQEQHAGGVGMAATPVQKPPYWHRQPRLLQQQQTEPVHSRSSLSPGLIQYALQVDEQLQGEIVACTRYKPGHRRSVAADSSSSPAQLRGEAQEAGLGPSQQQQPQQQQPQPPQQQQQRNLQQWVWNNTHNLC